MSGLITLLDREMYSVPQAADLLRIPTQTLWRWLEGHDRKGQHYLPVIRQEPTGGDIVTWGEFVEAGYLREYRARQVPLQQMRPFMAELRERLGVPWPLAHARPWVADRKLVLEVQETEALDPDLRLVVWESGQLSLAPAAQSFFHKIEFEADVVGRLRPDGRESPVVIDPERSFGNPIVKGVPTETLAELFRAGEPLELIADGYELAIADVEAALRFELTQLTAA